jgi:hypothetical protein
MIDRDASGPSQLDLRNKNRFETFSEADGQLPFHFHQKFELMGAHINAVFMRYFTR